uniref:ABC transmembrane type-1 domain-containing protein n=1 Tax=Panagrolaimus sp. PS1159 TaxID=55785 RepID=A0AC35G8Q2_9BILA
EVREVLAQLEKLDPVKTRELQRQISQSVERLSPSPSPGPLSPARRTETARKSIENFEKESLLNNSNANHTANATKKIDDGFGTNEKSKLIEKEGMETGKVKLSVYMTYLKAIGWKVSLLFLVIYIVSSILGVFSNLYLADWSDHAAAIQKGENGSAGSHVRLGIYTALGLGQAFSVCIASILMALGMVIASRILHEAMLTNILRSPMSFFDVTPLGRILNRFGKDIAVTDLQLPASLINMIGMLVQGIFILSVPIIVTPSILFGLIPVIFGYFLLLRFYVSTSRQLKRLESTTRSPIYSHFQESIQGASSIRAYHCTENFLLESQNRVDYNMLSYYPSIVANRWLAVRLELVGNLIVLLSALL